MALMDKVSVIVFRLFAGAVIGWIFSTVALVSPIRRWARRALMSRLALIALVGLVAALITYGLTSMISSAAEVSAASICVSSEPARSGSSPTTRDFQSGRCVERTPEREARLNRIQTEYWLRGALPFDVACYSDPDTCRGTDEVTRVLNPAARRGDPDAGLWALIVFVSAAVLTWLYTRPEAAGRTSSQPTS